MSFSKQLREHLDIWVAKSIISPEQKIIILNETSLENSTGKLFKIFSIIGVLFIGVGIILIISSNWAYLPKLIKLFLILLMPVGALGGGFFINQFQPDYKKIGDALIILGSLLIGASIALLGQLYHLDGSIGGLLSWWFVLSLPITMLFRYKTLSAVSAALLYASVFTLLVDTNRWWRMDEKTVSRTFTFLPLAIVILGQFLNRVARAKIFHNPISIFSLISIKIFLLTLFIGTFDDSGFTLLGESTASLTIQNALFLVTVFFVMWYANKNYLTVLRHSTFIWLAIYMVAKYFAWFWDYMSTGIFFVLFGAFLMAIVIGYVKFNKYTNQAKEKARQELIDSSNNNFKIQ